MAIPGRIKVNLYEVVMISLQGGGGVQSGPYSIDSFLREWNFIYLFIFYLLVQGRSPLKAPLIQWDTENWFNLSLIS